MSFDFPTFLALYHQYQVENQEKPHPPHQNQGDHLVLSRSQMQHLFRTNKNQKRQRTQTSM